MNKGIDYFGLAVVIKQSFFDKISIWKIVIINVKDWFLSAAVDLAREVGQLQALQPNWWLEAQNYVKQSEKE